MSFQTVSMKTFRAAVDRIKDQRDSVLIKTAYLTASRNCELLTKVNPCDLLHNASKPYGTFLKYKIADYEVASSTPDKEAVMEKVLVITTAVAKRGKRLKQPKEGEKETIIELKEEEVIEALMKFNQTKLLDQWRAGEIDINPMLIKILLGKITFKIAALPCSTVYEPWTKDLLKWISKTKGKLSFDIGRRRFIQILREHLSDIMPKISRKTEKNLLRHYRISHLLEYYNFDAMQITSYVGWSVSSTYNQMGITASPNLDYYSHMRWQHYFPRLLKPLEQLA